MLTSRVRSIGESATLRVSRRAAELKAAGRSVVSLGAGEPDFGSPPVAVEAAKAALDAGFTRYTLAAGTPDLRQALADRFTSSGAPWGADDVVVTVGGKASLFELALALFEAGDEVVIPAPYWVSFPEQVRFCGAEPVFVPMRRETGFALEAGPIVNAIGPRTKGIILNSPNNPSGGVISAEDLEAILEAAAARGVFVISDETYERFSYDGPAVSIAAYAARFPEISILVGSFSKTYAMTGWRVGYTLGPPAVIGAVKRIQSHAFSNVTSFAMPGARAALERAEPDVEAMIEEYRWRREFVIEGLRAIPGVECERPPGAFYAFPWVKPFYRGEIRGSVDLAEYLLDEGGVAVVPGVAFGCDEHVRLSFACSRADLEEGLGRMRGALGRLTSS